MRTGYADLPLHGGKAPAWLFQRMVRLSREIIVFMASEFGTDEFLRRLSDPLWFQSFGCVLGFDWHSSGVTTTVCGAVKEAIKGLENDLGIYPAGGKGKVSRKTPDEIKMHCERIGFDPEPLIYSSRMSAKVDNTALQDGYNLYHHFFLFTKSGRWAVIQQGLNEKTGKARRYHWLSDGVESFVVEPHAAICSEEKAKALNLVARDSDEARSAIVYLSSEKPEKVINELEKARKLELPKRHEVTVADIKPESIKKVLVATYEKRPDNFEKLLGITGVGPKTVRALALLSEIVYGAKPSFEDPAKFSFAHGGKDGYPYPVDRKTYEESIEFFRNALNRASIDRSEKIKAFRRLSKFL